MNAERLLAYYEQIADAPDAIARLRRFILDLAVRGKLLSQDPNDEPASELLKRTAKEKARLVKAGELRRPRDLDSGNDLNEPFAIPMTWRWVRLDAVGAIVGGGTPSAADADNFAEPGEGVPWLTPADLGGYSDLYISRGSRDLSEKGSRSSSATVMPKGSVLFTSRAPIGYVAIASNPLSTNQGFKSIVPYIADCSRFVATAMKAFAPEIDAKAPGTTFKEVSGKIVAAIPFPLPPLAEQHRIVAKVDELMGLCDRLAAARAGREELRDRLAAASLARLNAPDPETFQNDARFALDALPFLTKRADQINQVRQTILNLAVRGKLGGMTQGNFKPVGEYRTLQNGYAFKSEWFTKQGVRLLRNANIGHGKIRWDETVFFPPGRMKEFERFLLNAGDIVLTRDRPFIITGTKVARVTAGDTPSLLLQRVGRFVEVVPGLSDEYLFMWINSPHFSEQIYPGRSNGVPHISSKQVEAAEIFVPRLAEQHRIVAKVDALMALCDRLEASLTATAATRRLLLDALLAEALAPVDVAEMEAAE
jgi:type I restriction enzyme, S subunit